MTRALGVLVLGAAVAACSNGTIRKVDGGPTGSAGTTSNGGGTSGGGAGGAGGATSNGGVGGTTSSGGAGGTTSSGGAGGSDAAADAPRDAGDDGDGSAPHDAPVDKSADTGADAAPDLGGADAGAGEVGDAGADAGVDAGVDVVQPMPVTVSFTGKVVTVASAPLGFDATVRLEAVSGSFTYDRRMVDQLPADLMRGRWEGIGLSAFTFTVKGHTITGSGNAQVQTENLDPDTFRFLDGPLGDNVGRAMKLDGTVAPTLKLGIAITDSSGALLGSDALPAPFPTLDITTKPHTFSLQDSGGTLLMQLDTLTPS